LSTGAGGALTITSLIKPSPEAVPPPVLQSAPLLYHQGADLTMKAGQPPLILLHSGILGMGKGPHKVRGNALLLFLTLQVGSLPLESWCLLSYAGEVRRGLCPLCRSLFSFYLLLLGPAGQVQAEKEQVRGEIKQFLGGASPLQTSPAGGAKRPTLCRETTCRFA